MPPDTYHLNHADTTPHLAAGEHEAQRQASNRAWHALMLAQTPEAWARLLRGQHVPEDQLDRAALAKAKKRVR